MSRVCLFIIILFASPSVFGFEKILQILHTNDIHSYWEHADHKSYGGVAKLKTVMDNLEAEGVSNGWVTIKLDAGDFCDGNINFLSNKGTYAFEMEKALGFDVVALGNHDYMTGADDLVIHARNSDEKVPLVAANFNLPRETGIKPGYLIYRGGLRIAVSGATTKNTAFNWVAWPAHITAPLPPIQKWFDEQKADIRIALTHLGVDADRTLASRSYNIDVIVGGHTHIVLPRPVIVTNLLGKEIPIVQVGSLGMYLGEMLVKVSDQAPPQLISYKLHRIEGAIPEDPKIVSIIEKSHRDLDQIFGEGLDNVIANASQDFSTHFERTPLIGNLFADAMREAAGTEIAIDSGQFYSDILEAGPVSIRDVYNLAPHIYTWSSGGWHIFKCKTHSITLRTALSLLGASTLALGVSGMDLKLGPLDLVTGINIDGHPMQLSRPYTLALSEGFAYPVFARPRLENMLCSQLEDTGILVRDALLTKFKKIKTISPETLGARRIQRLIDNQVDISN